MLPDDFKKMRKAARWTQAQMAERLGKSRKTIVNWENDVFAIPDDALDILQEKGMSETPQISEISFKTHPEFYNASPKGPISRNHKHPHWWVRSLNNFPQVTPEIRATCESMVTTTADIGKLEWTPERAVVFLMSFLKVDRALAETMARQVGFDIPHPVAPIDPCIQLENDWIREHGFTAKAMEQFYALNPQCHKPAASVAIDPDLAAAIENAANS